MRQVQRERMQLPGQELPLLELGLEDMEKAEDKLDFVKKERTAPSRREAAVHGK